jgi:hypothetical protein
VSCRRRHTKDIKTTEQINAALAACNNLKLLAYPVEAEINKYQRESIQERKWRILENSFTTLNLPSFLIWQMPTANDSQQSGKAKTCINFNLLYHVALT